MLSCWSGWATWASWFVARRPGSGLKRQRASASQVSVLPRPLLDDDAGELFQAGGNPCPGKLLLPAPAASEASLVSDVLMGL